jgi:hypothetical protein
MDRKLEKGGHIFNLYFQNNEVQRKKIYDFI